MAVQKGGRFVAVRDCMYKGRFVPSGTVVELGPDEEMKNKAFVRAAEENLNSQRTIFDPTSKLATVRRVANATAGLSIRN